VNTVGRNTFARIVKAMEFANTENGVLTVRNVAAARFVSTINHVTVAKDVQE